MVRHRRGRLRRAYADMLGVTSIVRALNLDARCYNTLIDCFHSSRRETRPAPRAVDENGAAGYSPSRCAPTAGVSWSATASKIPKCGRKMPAVKLLHQQSEANTKPEFITGHSLQAVSLLVQAASSFFAVPLAVRIHEGLVWSNRDRRTLLDKMLALLGIAAVEQPFYFVAGVHYYATHKIVAGLLKQNNHLLTRMKSNAVAYTAYQQRGPRKRGRPRVYGSKIKLSSLWQASSDFQPAPSPVYGENKVIIQYRVRDLLWRPAGRLVRFVAVIHPTRGACLLMCTDTSLDAIDIIRLYGLRFKIEHTFKQAVNPDRFLHLPFLDVQHEAAAPQQRQSASPSCLARAMHRNDVKRKLHA